MLKNFMQFMLITVIISTTVKYSSGDEGWPGGFITLDTSPDSAAVYINGVKLGYTPIIGAIIDSGFTSIKIKKSYYHTYTRRIYTNAYKQEHHAGFVNLQLLSENKKQNSALVAKFGCLDSLPVLNKIRNTGGFPKGMSGCEKVVLNVLVDKHGKVIKTKLFKSSGNHIADSLASEVIKRSQFTPAMTSFHEPINCWVKVPLTFRNR
jgi:TonB family protein